MNRWKIRDSKMAVLLTIGTVLTLLLLSSTMLLTERYRLLATEKVFPSYPYVQWLDIGFPSYFDKESGFVIPEEAVVQMSSFFGECGKIADAEIMLYDGWELGDGNKSCIVGVMLSDGPHPAEKEAENMSVRQGVYIGRGYEYLAEASSDGTLDFFGERLPVLGTFRTKGICSDEVMYTYFSGMNHTMQELWVRDLLKRQEVFDKTISICIGSGEELQQDTLQTVQGMLENYEHLTFGGWKENGEDLKRMMSGDRTYLLIEQILNIVVLLVAVVSLFQLAGLWLSRRREDIAILRAVGMARGQIFFVIYKENLHGYCSNGIAMHFL